MDDKNLTSVYHLKFITFLFFQISICVRWVYVETLPSSAWPMMNDFWVTSGYGVAKSDPTTGIIESENLGDNQ